MPLLGDSTPLLRAMRLLRAATPLGAATLLRAATSLTMAATPLSRGAVMLMRVVSLQAS